MNKVALNETETVKDLEVWITNNLKVSNQCEKVFTKADRMLGVLDRTIENKSIGVIVKLFKSLIRPLAEYCTFVWPPYYLKDKEKIERLYCS
jgi:hypothetical protein